MSDADEQRISEIEVKCAFTESFWPLVERRPANGAICISHMRALNEALSQDPHVQLIVVLEEDVEMDPNTLPLFIGFLGHWFCNKAMSQTMYVALTYAVQSPMHAKNAVHI